MARTKLDKEVTLKLRLKGGREEDALQVIKSAYVKALKQNTTAWYIRGPVRSPEWQKHSEQCGE